MTDLSFNESTAPDEAGERHSIVSQIHGGGAGEDSGEFDLTMASAPKKSLPLQAMTVGLVLLVGAGALYLMRRQGTRAGIDFNNTTVVVSAVDTRIQKLENEDEILRALATTGPPEQVPKEKVRNDVFQIEKLGPSGGGPVLDGNPEGARLAHRRVTIKEALGRMQVESVILGRMPIAKISSKLYRIGDTLGGDDGKLFTVVRIEDRSVFLSVDDEEFELSMVR